MAQMKKGAKNGFHGCNMRFHQGPGEAFRPIRVDNSGVPGFFFSYPRISCVFGCFLWNASKSSRWEMVKFQKYQTCRFKWFFCEAKCREIYFCARYCDRSVFKIAAPRARRKRRKMNSSRGMTRNPRGWVQPIPDLVTD